MANGFLGRMQSMMQSLLPREHDFFIMFHSLADQAQLAAACLEQLFEDFSRLELSVQKVDEIEHAADHLVHDIVRKLDNTFVTPVLFDREDIYRIADTLDNTVDLIKGTIDRLRVFGFTSPDEHMRTMGRMIVQATDTLHDAVCRLDGIRLTENGFCATINALENEGDAALKRSLADLFAHDPDPLDVIKRKEIYEFLEKTLDSCEDAANLLENVIVKNA